MGSIPYKDSAYQDDHLWADDIVDPDQIRDERSFVELVHDGYLGKGYLTRAEAQAHLGRPGIRAVVRGEDGLWYCLALWNARRYNIGVDLMRRAK